MNAIALDILIRAASFLAAFGVIGYFAVIFLCVRNAFRAGDAAGKMRWAVTAMAVFVGVPVLLAHGTAAMVVARFARATARAGEEARS